MRSTSSKETNSWSKPHKTSPVAKKSHSGIYEIIMTTISNQTFSKIGP